MNEFNNKDIGNNISIKQQKILWSEQEIENHDTSETDENDIKVHAGISERKPIKNILFVDDEEKLWKLFKEALEKFGYKVWVAFNGNEGLKLFRENLADLIITDIFMPEKDGHTFIHEIMQEFPGTNIFAITGKKTFLGIDMELDAAETLGAKRVFAKPVKLSELVKAIKALDRT
ncbi:response regulator [Thermodesulfobacteriota bacterium]